MDYEEVDPLSLRIAARSGKKSVNRLSSLIRASLTLVWSSGRGLLVALTALQFASAVALAGQVLAVQLVLAAVLGAAGSGQVAGAGQGCRLEVLAVGFERQHVAARLVQ